jgi:hypothetical protein
MMKNENVNNKGEIPHRKYKRLKLGHQGVLNCHGSINYY